MKPLSIDQMELLLANGARMKGDTAFDPFPVVRLYTPNSGLVWLLCSIDPGDHDLAFGLVDLGAGYPELGFVSIRDIADYKGALRSFVELDQAFKADQPISRCALEATRLGRIP